MMRTAATHASNARAPHRADTGRSGDGRSIANGDGKPTVDLSAGSLHVDFSRGPIPFEELERELLQRALVQAGGSKTEAGRLLGMSLARFGHRIAGCSP